MNDGLSQSAIDQPGGVWGAPVDHLPVDALAEIPSDRQPEPEFGRSAGATVNIVTKSART